MFGWFRSTPALKSKPAPWNTMDSAPRDGTEIEIKCTYGYEPWTKVAKWEKSQFDGPVWAFDNGCFIEDRNFGPRSNGANNSYLTWRPVPVH